jgi:FlaG/FlaF family flagellin (archaellin)
MALMVLAAVFAACVTSSSGEASEPVVSAAKPTSEAGSAAISLESVDADTCVGVLTRVEGDLKLFTDSLTSSVNKSEPQIVSMCSAMYDTGEPGREFLAVVLIHLESGDAAVDHYKLMKGAYAETGAVMSEINNADEGLIDELSALSDSNGIGRTSIFRQSEWLVTVTVGPTMAESLWNTGDMESIGRGVLDRVK